MNKELREYPPVLTASDIAEILRISKPTAYQMMDETDFPLIKVGRCKRVDRESFRRWLLKRSESTPI